MERDKHQDSKERKHTEKAKEIMLGEIKKSSSRQSSNKCTVDAYFYWNRECRRADVLMVLYL